MQLTSIVHILLPETDNCPSWISRRKRMTINVLHDRSPQKNVTDLAGIKPTSSWSSVRRASNSATEASTHIGKENNSNNQCLASRKKKIQQMKYWKIFLFFFSPGNTFWPLMQTDSNGDNLHEMKNPVFWEKLKNNINLSSAKLVQRLVKVNCEFSMLYDKQDFKFPNVNFPFLSSNTPSALA